MLDEETRERVERIRNYRSSAKSIVVSPPIYPSEIYDIALRGGLTTGIVCGVALGGFTFIYHSLPIKRAFRFTLVSVFVISVLSSGYLGLKGLYFMNKTKRT
eukprot:TRINITY_DN14828_c0_g1_i2.p1 TRINITY_DN14828_c0_g1~~TRINITY_DN14828_c0_g1_i2.p1  ORF type:complete len:102 (-),score=3.65 TRINITY_DN14828_c0_g1_i2:85-390(-)